jgi:hypothetical protein
MGPTLDIAAAMNAYTLTDRATWANFNNHQHLEILAAGDPMLLNPYTSILVNPTKWPYAKFVTHGPGMSGLHQSPALMRLRCIGSTANKFLSAG